jgi:hypothetical protein
LIKLPPLDPEEVRRTEKRMTYWQQLHDRVTEERGNRLRRLRSQESAIRQATELYQQIDNGQASDGIRLRIPFVSIPPGRANGKNTDSGDESAPAEGEMPRRLASSRPPLSRLIFRRSRSLSLYLTCVYVAHLEFSPGTQVVNEHGINGRRSDQRPQSWARLAGMAGTGNNRARRARVVRALDQLHAANLVALSSRSDKYEKFELLKDDGSGERYLVPGLDSGDFLTLPNSFFYYGWHLALEANEIATYLALWEASVRLASALKRLGQPGVALPERVRSSRYGLSDEAYESIHNLEEFGLVKIHDPMPNRRYGRFSRSDSGDAQESGQFAPQPYQISFLRGLDRDAHDVISKSLLGNSIPPRLT